MKSGLLVLLAGIILSATFFSSCQQEVQPPDQQNLQDSVISRIMAIDTTLSSGSDTSHTIDFTYDASKRLSKFIDTEYNLGVSGPGRLDYIAEKVYGYSGATTLPATIIATVTDAATSAVDVNKNFYTYTNGYISVDSFSQSFSYRVLVYNKIGDNRYKVTMRVDNGGGGQIIDTGYVSVTRQNGNMVKEVDSMFLFGGPWVVTSVTNTYDSKPNIFKSFSLPIVAPYFGIYPGYVGYTDFGNPSENNLRLQVNDLGTTTESYNYEYGPTGLPKISRSGSLKIYYYYKVL